MGFTSWMAFSASRAALASSWRFLFASRSCLKRFPLRGIAKKTGRCFSLMGNLLRLLP